MIGSWMSSLLVFLHWDQVDRLIGWSSLNIQEVPNIVNGSSNGKKERWEIRVLSYLSLERGSRDSRSRTSLRDLLIHSFFPGVCRCPRKGQWPNSSSQKSQGGSGPLLGHFLLLGQVILVTKVRSSSLLQWSYRVVLPVKSLTPSLLPKFAE